MGPSVRRVLPIYSNGSAPSNEVAAMPIYGKSTEKSFSPEPRKLGIKHRGPKVHQVCSNNDSRLTFDLFTTRSNLRPYTFKWGKC